MEDEKPTCQLLTNPILRFFSSSYCVSVIIVYMPIIVFLLVMESEHFSLGQQTLLMLLGAMLWVVSEYVLHRFVYHYKPCDSKWEKLNPVYHLMTAHDLHHRYPKDLSGVMPLVLSIPLYGLIYLLFKWVFSSNADMLLSGFMLGYVIYETLHWSAHNLPIPTKIGRFLKYHHMRHHYFESKTCFGVTSPVLDLLFKTYSEGRRPQKK